MTIYSYWGRLGVRARRHGFKALGLEQTVILYDKGQGRLFFDAISGLNVRKAHCKICGGELKPGEGIPIGIYAENWWNLSFYYGHEKCRDKVLGTN